MSSSSPKHKAVELKSSKNDPLQKIALEKLKHYRRQIWYEGSKLEFKYGTTIYSGKLTQNVPLTLARAFNASLQGPDHGEGNPVDALVNLIAVIIASATKPDSDGKRLEKTHKGRSPKTQEFYTEFLNIKGSDIFPNHPQQAMFFDNALASKIAEKDRVLADNDNVTKFNHYLKQEEKNINGVERILKDIPLPMKAKVLLKNIMVHMLTSCDSDDLAIYKKDYISILDKHFPEKNNPLKNQLIRAIEDFTHHHNMMMTNLSARKKSFYISAACQAASIGIKPLLTAIPGSETITGLIGSVNAGPVSLINSDILMDKASSAIGDYGPGALSPRSLQDSVTTSPILPVVPDLTLSEIAMKAQENLSSDETMIKAGLGTGILIASLVTGPPGMIVGAAVGMVATIGFAVKDLGENYLKLAELKKIAQTQRKEHDNQFLSYISDMTLGPEEHKRVREWEQATENKQEIKTESTTDKKGQHINFSLTHKGTELTSFRELVSPKNTSPNENKDDITPRSSTANAIHTFNANAPQATQTLTRAKTPETKTYSETKVEMQEMQDLKKTPFLSTSKKALQQADTTPSAKETHKNTPKAKGP